MKVLIPMAGRGQRFVDKGITTPKPFIQVGSKPMIQIAVETLNIPGQYIFVTRPYDIKNSLANSNDIATLRQVKSNAIIISAREFTSSSVATCFEATTFIQPQDELIITNCDQLLFNWEPEVFLKKMRESDAEGGVLTFKSNDPRHSYARVEGNKVLEIIEKKVISDVALVGVHYWRYAAEFFRCASRLVESLQNSSREAYISETYNFTIKQNRKVIYHDISPGKFIPLGTPEDIKSLELSLL